MSVVPPLRPEVELDGAVASQRRRALDKARRVLAYRRRRAIRERRLSLERRLGQLDLEEVTSERRYDEAFRRANRLGRGDFDDGERAAWDDVAAHHARIVALRAERRYARAALAEAVHAEEQVRMGGP